MLMKGLEFVRGQHKSHFYIFEGLQEDSGSNPTTQPIKTLFINHSLIYTSASSIKYHLLSLIISPFLPPSYSILYPNRILFYMRERNTFNFVRHFLRNSPRNQLSKYKKAFEMPNVQLQLGVTPLSNRSYLLGFLKSVEVFGQPTSEVKMQNIQNQVSIRKILKQQRMAYKPYETAPNQTQQILLCIKQMTGPSPINLTHYHQLQQRIVIAQTQTIMEVRQRLTYLFKILLNKRDKLPPQSLDLDANLQLTEAIIKAFAKNSEFGQNNKEWNKLQAMDKFMRARQYKKKGYHSVAINSFEQIFRDDAATYQIRLQALKLLCNEGEEQGDVSKLEHLVSFTHQKGQKQYEEYLKIMIQKIKGNLSQKTSDS